MEELKNAVTQQKIKIKHSALIECFRQGLLPLHHEVSRSLQNSIRSSLSEYGVRPWSLCPECEVDSKNGFVHIGRVFRQEVIDKIDKDTPFCPNELFVIVVHLLRTLHIYLCDMGTNGLKQMANKEQTDVANFMSVDLLKRQIHDYHRYNLNSRRCDEFVKILASNVKLNLIFENPCEVLKAFSAKGPYRNISVIEDLPVLAVVSSISNCGVFAKYLNIDVRTRKELLVKVTLRVYEHKTDYITRYAYSFLLKL